MNAAPPTQVVVLTPPGRGAVATVRVEGPQAAERVAARFRSASGLVLNEQPIGKILFGRWGGEDAGEELVVARRGERAWEIHGHGGAAAVAAIVQSLVTDGCERIAWRDWLRQTDSDPLRAEAHLALADVRTERAAAILLDQYHGALRRAVEQTLAALQADETPAAQRQLRDLLRREPLGRHLVAPWRVVLAGRPNVGKSSLVNALVGYRRAIVYDQPGTTRDVVTAPTAIDGWPVELADTAGLRAGGEAIEAAGIERARAGLAAADVVVLVFDASAPWSAEDQQLADAWPRAPRVHNKADLAREDPARPEGLFTSAKTGQGIDRLVAAISQLLWPEPTPPGQPVPFAERHFAALHAALEYLAAGQPSEAARRLEELLED
jgi:tRNA modification GTPase